MAQAEFALLGQCPGIRGCGFLALEGGLSPHALLHLLLVLDEEEGGLLDPRKVVPTVGNTVPYPINSILSQLDNSLGRQADPILEPKVPLWKYPESHFYL